MIHTYRYQPVISGNRSNQFFDTRKEAESYALRNSPFTVEYTLSGRREVPDYQILEFVETICEVDLGLLGDANATVICIPTRHDLGDVSVEIVSISIGGSPVNIWRIPRSERVSLESRIEMDLEKAA